MVKTFNGLLYGLFIPLPENPEIPPDRISAPALMASLSWAALGETAVIKGRGMGRRTVSASWQVISYLPDAEAIVLQTVGARRNPSTKSRHQVALGRGSKIPGTFEDVVEMLDQAVRDIHDCASLYEGGPAPAEMTRLEALTRMLRVMGPIKDTVEANLMSGCDVPNQLMLTRKHRDLLAQAYAYYPGEEKRMLDERRSLHRAHRASQALAG